MIILDLNHVEIISESTQVEGGFYNFYENDFVKLEIVSKPRIKGNSAIALADSAAYGKNTFAKSVTYTETNQGYSSEASSASVAGSKGSYFWF
ncbi:hypothetical protein [Tychonema sp. BBK16]|uniref:hypothetical protein n=1 Tax=Tychonema sp. BBK16 TaxID=2699888 RepID=UPI001F15BE1E|nr:hypothetical protein [Tychonema sp. BBK16]MCF6373639.1 hypothetical protein [Tychonema sp. BBK16]